MSGQLDVLHAGPGMTVQDRGRRGFRAQGLTAGGAADRMALAEGAALLDQSGDLAAIEMAGAGGSFRCTSDLRIALTGADMGAAADGAPLAWNACHMLPAGTTLTLGGAKDGSYGYLHVGGGIATQPIMGARAGHLAAGLGKAIAAGDSLPLGPDKGGPTGRILERGDRFGGGTVHIVASMQTANFAAETLDRFVDTEFRRDTRANRVGVRMTHDGEGFFAEGQLSIVSEVIVPGDIQITGDGAPYVLMGECQTTGGYPRIGTVLPSDLPRVAQARAGDPIRFRLIETEEAIMLERRARDWLAGIAGRISPLTRNPHEMRDLLSYQLVGGAVSAMADPFEEEDRK